MKWTVSFSRRASKEAHTLHERALLALQILTADLRLNGPAPGKEWLHYGKLQGSQRYDRRHCHLTRGKPTYVCCWEVDKTKKTIEVYYVGTHERAPY